MSKETVVEADVVEDSLAVVESASIGQTFWSSDPDAMLEIAGKQANALKSVIDQKHMSTQIKGRTHVNIEGWQTLGAMVGVFAVIEWSRPLLDEDGKEIGWEARAVAQTPAGQTVGAAEAECRRTESTWSKRDSYALRSMAQTRAMSKALRGPLGFIIHIAGYSATPEEEMVATMSPYQQAATYAVRLLGDKDTAKAAFEDACAAAGIGEPKRMTADGAEAVIEALNDAYPDQYAELVGLEAPYA